MQLLDSTYTSNAKLDKLIHSYSVQIDSLVDVVVGYNAHAMHIKKPESDLGNLLADYLVWFSTINCDSTIVFGIFNSGGFRIPLPPGKITVGHIMQLMPFDNTLVSMTLSGVDMQLLAEQIIEKGGDPISSPYTTVSIRSSKNKVMMEIGGDLISPEKTYRIVTSSYLAEGGDGYTVLLKGSKVSNSGIFIRDALQQMYQETTNSANPASRKIEGRIEINP